MTRQVAYGQIATEADIAATEIVQIIVSCRVARSDPQEPVAAYLRDAFSRIAERQTVPADPDPYPLLPGFE